MINMRTVSRVVIVTVLYYVAAAALLHFRHPDVDPVAIPMSAYVLTSSGALMTTTYWTLAISLIGVVVGLRRVLRRTVLSSIGLVLFSIAALGATVAGVFPGEPPPAQTLSGRIHFACAIVVFPTLAVAIVLCSLAIRKDARWRAVAAWLTWLAVGVAISTVLFPIVAPRGAGGLAQRADFLFVFAWMVVVAYQLPRIAGVTQGGFIAKQVQS